MYDTQSLLNKGAQDTIGHPKFHIFQLNELQGPKFLEIYYKKESLQEKKNINWRLNNLHWFLSKKIKVEKSHCIFIVEKQSHFIEHLSVS